MTDFKKGDTVRVICAPEWGFETILEVIDVDDDVVYCHLKKACPKAEQYVVDAHTGVQAWDKDFLKVINRLADVVINKPKYQSPFTGKWV